MSEAAGHGWAIGFGFGGAALAGVLNYPSKCTNAQGLTVDPAVSTLGRITGDVTCTNPLGGPTFELSQSSTLVVSVIAGVILAILFELAALSESNSPSGS